MRRFKMIEIFEKNNSEKEEIFETVWEVKNSYIVGSDWLNEHKIEED